MRFVKKLEDSSKSSLESLLKENVLLRGEVRVARQASEITAKLVVEQFVKTEKMLQRIADSESRYRDLYQESSQREQMYRSLLNSTPDAVIIYDLSEIPIYTNPAFTRIFGYRLQDVAVQGFQLLIESERQQMREKFKRAISGEPISGWETQAETRDGQCLDVQISASCYRDYQGQPAGVMTIVQDVTSRKQVERRLLEERATFLKMLDKAPFGAGLLDLHGNLIHSNEEMRRITGYHREDLKSLEDWFRLAYPDPDHRKKAREAWIEGGRDDVGSRVFEITCKDGRNKLVEFRRNVLGEEGTVVTLCDVTEREKAQTQIRHAKEEWERTFDAIEDLVTIQDADMRLMRVNLAVARMLGEDPRNLIGKKCHELFCNCASTCANCPGLKTLEDHLPHTSEITHKELGKTFSVSTWPILDSDGAFLGLVHAAKDISDKRQMEEELLKAQKLESIGVLAGGIAHDFNNILTVVLGNISLARAMVPNGGEALLTKLQCAEKATLAARDLTQQLLTFAKGGAPILKAESIEACIKDSVSFITRGANVVVVYDIARDLWPAEADKAQITQVINNLVINAVQAMPKGGTIRVSARNLDSESKAVVAGGAGPLVKISITDEGEGIEEEHLNKIFDPYFTTKPNGSGLGLATAFSIVNRHGGRLTVESTVGVGTTFSIYLPASQKPVQRPQSVETEMGRAKGRILVMDDEDLIRDIVGEMLRFIGYQVGFAADGQEAIERFEAAREAGYPFDAVIMDLTVPGGIGGEEAVKRLLETSPDAKAIVSSGYSNDPVMSSYESYGFKAMVTKPYKIRELSSVLQRVLSG